MECGRDDTFLPSIFLKLYTKSSYIFIATSSSNASFVLIGGKHFYDDARTAYAIIIIKGAYAFRGKQKIKRCGNTCVLLSKHFCQLNFIKFMVIIMKLSLRRAEHFMKAGLMI